MANRELTPFGLSRAIIERIVRACAARPEVRRVVLYGSRARGDFHSGSDIDLAVDAPDMESATFARLQWDLDDEPILFRLDLHRLQDLDEKVRRKVERDGVVLYARAEEFSSTAQHRAPAR